MSTDKHTPTPWVYPRDAHPAPDMSIFSTVKPKGATSEHGPCVAHVLVADDTTGFLPRGQYVANAEFIVRAVNAHEALVEAARALIHYDTNEKADGVQMMVDYDNALSKAKAALALIEEAK